MTASDLPFIKSRRARWAILLLIASLPLLGWWSYGLFDLDEGFYAAVTGSMIRHHEWITPLYNGHPWFEKPILIYWLAKPPVMLFGQAFGPRLPSILATVATYALVAWFVRRRFGGLAAVVSLFVLSSSLLVIGVGRMMMTDPLLLFFFTAAMLTFWESVAGEHRWRLVTAACLGLAVLAKGPVALILFALIAGWTWWSLGRTRNSERGARNLEFLAEAQSTQSSQRSDGDSRLAPGFKGFWLLGTAILFMVIATWYVPAYLANGQTFVQDFLIKQNIGRFTGGDQAHTLPFYKGFWFYIPVLLLGMFPWILWLPAAWPGPILDRGSRIAEMEEKAGMTSTIIYRSEIPDPRSAILKSYLASWALIIFIFFTVSGAKLPHYILPCCPPLAILIGTHLAERWGSLGREALRPKLLWAAWWLLGSWILAQGGFEWWYGYTGQAEAHQFARYISQQNRDTNWPVAAYKLPRRTKDLGTGKPKIQETSLPSLSFYVNQDMVETDRFADLDAAPKPVWIFTRVGRIGTDTSGNLSLERQGAYYDVFLLRS